MRYAPFWRKRDPSCGSKGAIERSNAIDRVLREPERDQNGRRSEIPHGRYDATFLVIGERDVAMTFVQTLRSEQLKLFAFAKGEEIGQTQCLLTPTPHQEEFPAKVKLGGRQADKKQSAARRAYAELLNEFCGPTGVSQAIKSFESDTDCIAFSYLFSSLIYESQPPLNPEDILANLSDHVVQHRISSEAPTRVSMPHTRDDLYFQFHVLGHLDPTYSQIAKNFYDIQYVIFIIDLAQLSSTDPITGLPYMVKQMDYFTRCITPPTSFTRRSFTMFLLFVNYDLDIVAKDASISSILLSICPDCQLDDLDDYNTDDSTHKLVAQYLCRKFRSLATSDDSCDMDFYMHLVPKNMDQNSIRFFIAELEEIFPPAPVVISCFGSSARM